jgi:hypothetical protein
MAARKKNPAKPPVVTAYVVLEAVTIAESTEHPGAEVVWAPVRNQTAEQGPDGQPRVFEAHNKTAAIRQHTGTGEDVKPGSWKAIPVSSWKGGETTRTKITAERLPLDEALG